VQLYKAIIIYYIIVVIVPKSVSWKK